MARRQHILALCVTALLLTAGSSAADADAAAAAEQAAATPAVPQTSTNVASADPDSSVRVSQQTAREKAANGRTGNNGLKPMSAPSPAPAAPKADAGTSAVPVSGKQPPAFPGAVGSVTPVTTQQQSATPVAGSITATFPGAVSMPANKASPAATSSSGGEVKAATATKVPVAATPVAIAATPEPAAAAPAGAEDAKKKKKKKTTKGKKKEKTAGTAEGATEDDSADDAEDRADGTAGYAASPGGSATAAAAAKVPQPIRTTSLDATAKPESAIVATPATSAAAAKAEAVPANLPAAAVSSTAKPVGASATAKAVDMPASVPAAAHAATGASAAAKSNPAASAAKTEAVPASVPAAAATSASAAAESIPAASTPKTEAVPASVPAAAAAAKTAKDGVSATAAASPAAASAATKPVKAAEAKKAAAAEAAAQEPSSIKPVAVPGAAATPGQKNVVAAGKSVSLAVVEPEGTLYDGQGNVVQTGIPATAPIPSRVSAETTSINPRSGQVATTDVSDRSALALDRAAIVAAKMAPAQAPAVAKAVAPAHAPTVAKAVAPARAPAAAKAMAPPPQSVSLKAKAMAPAHAPAAAKALAPAPQSMSLVANRFFVTNPGTSVADAGTPTNLQSTGGSGNSGAEAQSFLSGLANSLSGNSQQDAPAQGTGATAQPYASTAQSAPSNYAAIPQQASANAGSASGGAGASDANSGVLSGTTYQSSGATSPLTPYNTAMDNSIGNFGKQLGGLLKGGGQQGSANLQQTPTVDAVNAFQQPQLPANRDIVHLSIPEPNLASAGNSLGRRLLGDAGNEDTQNMESADGYSATTTTPAVHAGNILQSAVGRLQDAAYSLHNKLQGADIQSMPMAATIAQPVQADSEQGTDIQSMPMAADVPQPASPAAAPTAGTRAGVAQALTPQWTIDPSLQQPAGSAGAQQSSASSGSAQPMAASVSTPFVASPAADSVQGANVGSAQPMAATVASAAPAHITGVRTADTTQTPVSLNQPPLPSSMQTGTSANAVADGMQRAVNNAQNMRNSHTAHSANPQAISAAAMADSEQTASPAAGPSVLDASAMAATMQQQQGAQQMHPQATIVSPSSVTAPSQQAAQAAPQQQGAQAAPQQQGAQQMHPQATIVSPSSVTAPSQQAAQAAPQQQVTQPNQHQASSSTPKGLTQIGSSGSDPMSAGANSGQAQPMGTTPMGATSGSPPSSPGGVLVNAGRPTSMEQSLGGTTGFVAGIMAGRRLQQVAGATGSPMAATLSKDPKVQATAANVIVAAAAASGAYWTAAPTDTTAAQQLVTLAAADPETIVAAKKLEAVITAAVQTSHTGKVPAFNATAVDIKAADLLADPMVQGKLVPLIQASAAASGASWVAVAQGVSGAAQAVITKSEEDNATLAAAHELTKVVLSEAAKERLGTLFSGRRLLDAQKSDGSLQAIVHDAVNDPATQAAFTHVMEAAATETKALSQLSGPATAPAPGSMSTVSALSALVSSVSHNALASALPGQPPSNQQQFNDWENSLQSPAANKAKQAAAQQDAGALKGFDPAAAGKQLAQQVDQAASSVLLGIGRRRLTQEQAQPSLDLDPYIKSLQEVGSEFQEAGQAAGNAVGLTPARLHAAGVQLQEGTQNALIGAAKHVVRTIGVDSNTPGSATPGSEYGYNPISSVIPYSASAATAPAGSTSSIQSTESAVPQATGFQQISSASPASAAVDSSAAQEASPSADSVATGRKLHANGAQTQTQAQAQAQASEETANTVKALIAGVSSLASVVKTALAPTGAVPAAPVPAAQQTAAQSQVRQTQAAVSNTPAQPQVSQQAADPYANLQSQYGGTSGGGGGHVGVTQATTFAGENGNQLPANDIHIDNTPSSFVIGPDGKVPSLASEGGAAAVAQQQGLLVPNGAAASQSASPSPSSYGTGYGVGAGPNSATSGYGSSSGTSTPSYGYGATGTPTYGSSSGSTTPSYGTSGGGTATPTYSAATPTYGSASPIYSTPSTGASSVPGTVTAYNQGQSYGSSQQSNASGAVVQSNTPGPSVQGTSFANTTPPQQYQPQQGTAQAAASYQQAMAPMQG